MSGSEFRAIRRALGMTQIEIADLFDVSVETISRWECDRGGPIPLLSAFAMEELADRPREVRARLEAMQR